jgi:hypothetical protein
MAVIGVLAVGGAAAATLLTTNTIGAPGFCQTITAETAGIPFPPGYQSWKNWTLLRGIGPKPGTTLHELCDTPAGAHVADDGYPGTFEVPAETARAEDARAAFCAWADVWLRAKGDGNSTTASRAASEIAGALNWPGSEVADPRQSHISDTKIVFPWFLSAQHAVRTGDVAALTPLFKFNHTRTAKPPDAECLIPMPPARSDDGTLYPKA